MNEPAMSFGILLNYSKVEFHNRLFVLELLNLIQELEKNRKIKE
jgi:hypothetical protein